MAQGWAGSDRQAGRLRHEGKKKFSLIQRYTPCESSRLCAVQQAAYCINLPQLANHCTCEEKKNHLTVSSTGQDSQRDIFACEDK